MADAPTAARSASWLRHGLHHEEAVSRGKAHRARARATRLTEPFRSLCTRMAAVHDRAADVYAAELAALDEEARDAR